MALQIHEKILKAKSFVMHLVRKLNVVLEFESSDIYDSHVKAQRSTFPENCFVQNSIFYGLMRVFKSCG